MSRYRRAGRGLIPAHPEREAVLQSFVRVECRRCGLLHYHPHRSDRSEPGFPDSVIVGPGGVLFRELKSATGRPSPDQVVWLQRLREAGADADIWTPADKYSGRISNELNRLARRRPRPAHELRAELAAQLSVIGNGGIPTAAARGDLLLGPDGRESWCQQADAVAGLLAAALPRSAEQVGAWLRAHRLIAPTPQQLFAALAHDLTAPRGADR